MVLFLGNWQQLHVPHWNLFPHPWRVGWGHCYHDVPLHSWSCQLFRSDGLTPPSCLIAAYHIHASHLVGTALHAGVLLHLGCQAWSPWWWEMAAHDYRWFMQQQSAKQCLALKKVRSRYAFWWALAFDVCCDLISGLLNLYHRCIPWSAITGLMTYFGGGRVKNTWEHWHLVNFLQLWHPGLRSKLACSPLTCVKGCRKLSSKGAHVDGTVLIFGLGHVSSTSCWILFMTHVYTHLLGSTYAFEGVWGLVSHVSSYRQHTLGSQYTFLVRIRSPQYLGGFHSHDSCAVPCGVLMFLLEVMAPDLSYDFTAATKLTD